MSEPDVLERMRRELVLIFHDTGIDTGNLLAAVDEVQGALIGAEMRAEAAEGREARLRNDLLGLRRACLNKGGTTCRLCQGTWIASEGEKVSDHHDGCPMRQTAALAGTPEGET